MEEREVAVIGAGPAGVAAALALKDVGVRPTVFDRADRVASSWRGRYDRLRLNTCRPFSHLPDRRYPKGTPMFPSRDQLIEHVERHAEEDGIEIRLGTSVEAISRGEGGWSVETSAGEVAAPQVVIATGYQNEPVLPSWQGREEFGGRLLHSSQYRNPEPFRGESVLVVGPGCSGMEIAHDLAEGGAARTWLAVRTPPNIVLREGPGGMPGDMIAVALLHSPVRFADAFSRFGRRMGVGDLDEFGLTVPDDGPFTQLRSRENAPTIVDEEVIEAIRQRRVEVVSAVEACEPDGVRLEDGARLAPDSIVAATGFRPALERLVGHLDVLDPRGRPKAVGEKAAALGMRFVGYVQRPGGLGYMGKEAKRAARAIARELTGRRGVRVGSAILEP